MICDALFGARAMGDIGAHFPDTDAAYKGIDSKILLRETVAKVCTDGWEIVNVDATICLQAPKLRPHIDAMRECISGCLGIPVDRVGVKATTTERLGFVGTGGGHQCPRGGPVGPMRCLPGAPPGLYLPFANWAP